MRLRQLVVAGIVTALVVILSGCASADASPRTTPNQAELDALQRARLRFSPAIMDYGDGYWLQLWTPSAAGPVVESCVAASTHDLLSASVHFSERGVLGYSLSAGVAAPAAGESNPYRDQDTAFWLFERCIATTPVDTRASHIPRSAWPALYTYERTVLRPCLTRHGQQIDPMPSRARFLELMRAGAPWSPYDFVVVRHRLDWFALSDACPAIPPEKAGG